MKIFASAYQRLNRLREGVCAAVPSRLDLETCTVPQLERRLTARTLKTVRTLSPWACRELMRRAAARTLDRRSSYHPSCTTPGFGRYLLALYRQVLLHGATLAALHGENLADLARVFDCYQRLSEGMDPAEARRNFYRGLGGFPSFWAPGEALEVEADGPLTRDRRMFFDALASRGAQVSFALGVPHRAEYGELLESFGAFPLRLLETHENPAVRAVLFDESPEGPVPGLRLMRAGGAYRELEQVFRDIHRRLRAPGAPDPHRVAVFVPALAGVMSYVRDLSRRFGVPVYQRAGVPLSALPLTGAMLLLPRLVLGGYRAGDMEAIASNPYWNAFWPGGDADGAGNFSLSLRAFVREARVLGGLESWGACALPRVRAVLALARDLAGRKTLSDFAAFFTDWLRRAEPRLPEWSSRDVRTREALLLLAAGFGRECGWIGSLDQPMDLARFDALLRAETQAASVSGVQGQPTGVQVLELGEGIGCRFDYVYVLTVNDRVVPPVPASDPVLDAGQRRRLGLPSSGVRRQAALMGFYGALASCRLELCLSWQDSSESGDEMIPSYLVEDIRRRLHLASAPAPYGPETLVPTFDRCQTPEDYLRCALAFSTDEATLLRCLPHIRPGPELDYLARKRGLDAEGRETRREWTSGAFGREVSGRVAAGGFELSASALSTLLECPLQWYLRYWAGVREEVPVGGAPDPRLVGTARHRCLQTLMTRFPESAQWESLPPRAVPDALDEAWRHTGVVPRGADGRAFRFFFERDARAIAQTLARESGGEPFRVLACELAFGPGRAQPGVLLPNPAGGGGGVLLTGTLDRLDRVGGGLRVVDYKHADFHSRAVKAGFLAQLSVYLLFVRGHVAARHGADAASVTAACLNLKEDEPEYHALDRLLPEGATADGWFSASAAGPSFSATVWRAVGELMQGRVRAGEGGCGRCLCRTGCPAAGEAADEGEED